MYNMESGEEISTSSGIKDGKNTRRSIIELR
jgi:hypothetical protein